MTKSIGTHAARKPKTLTPQRSAGPMDTQLGQKIRIRRVEQNISQAELGAALGVSFQQIQKYEKGINRVGAARLTEIAKALDVGISYFYGDRSKMGHEVESLLFIDPNFSIRLLRAYSAVPQTVQRHIVSLLESMAPQAA